MSIANRSFWAQVFWSTPTLRTDEVGASAVVSGEAKVCMATTSVQHAQGDLT